MRINILKSCLQYQRKLSQPYLCTFMQFSKKMDFALSLTENWNQRTETCYNHLGNNKKHIHILRRKVMLLKFTGY